MTTTLPTRSQLNDAVEFFATFAGEAYKDGGIAELEIPDEARSLTHLRVDHGQTVVQIPEGVVQKYLETWLRANWDHIVDCMVDSHCALEDEVAIEDRPCPKKIAHGEHYWDYTQFLNTHEGRDQALLNGEQDFHCEGIKAHPRCMIAGGRNADA